MKAPKRRPWPRLGSGGVEAAQWRVLIAHRLREWRKADTDLLLKSAAPRSGLSQDAISRIETGGKGVDVLELRALAAAYGKSAVEVGRLFRAPTEREWGSVRAGRADDERFLSPPSGGLPLR